MDKFIVCWTEYIDKTEPPDDLNLKDLIRSFVDADDHTNFVNAQKYYEDLLKSDSTYFASLTKVILSTDY